MDNGVIDLVDRAYRAAVEPALWPSVLEGAADLFQAERAILIDSGGWRRGEQPAYGFEPEALSEYFQIFQALNPVQSAIDRARRQRAETPAVSTVHSWVDADEFEGSTFYNEYFLRFDMHSALLMRLGGPGEGPTLNVLRSRRRGEFEARDLALAEALRRPLHMAYQLGEQLRAERRAGEGFAQVVDRMSGAVLLTDDDGCVVYANPAAEALLAGHDGLCSRPEGLRAAGADDGRRLSRLIAAACSEHGPDPGGAIAIARPSGRRPLAVLVGALACDGRRLALIRITDPEQEVRAPHERLRELYGLTSAEARAVAELVAGHEPRAIAERLEISLNTVRVQLARAMAKTGTQRQSELVSLVTRTLGGWS